MDRCFGANLHHIVLLQRGSATRTHASTDNLVQTNTWCSVGVLSLQNARHSVVPPLGMVLAIPLPHARHKVVGRLKLAQVEIFLPPLVGLRHRQRLGIRPQSNLQDRDLVCFELLRLLRPHFARLCAAIDRQATFSLHFEYGRLCLLERCLSQHV